LALKDAGPFEVAHLIGQYLARDSGDGALQGAEMKFTVIPNPFHDVSCPAASHDVQDDICRANAFRLASR
jgi:hypothetical protein